MTWRIEFLESVVKGDIAKLPRSHRETIRRAIDQRLATNPVAYGKPLRYSFKGMRRIRVGDYRIIYRIEPESHTVLITRIRHRKDVYSE